MCKEDVRLARAAVPGDIVTVAAVTGGVKLLGGNGERYSISASLGTGIDATSTFSVLIYARIGGLVYPLMGLSSDHPAGTISLLDTGQIIQSEIWAMLLNATTAINVTAAESKWNQTQESI